MGIPRIEPLELHATLPSGPRNLITDVAGVRVGHATVQQGEVNTGVTAVLPHPGNLFLDKVMASAAVINGFGKSAGILQVQELGTIETPILLTNTLSVGTAFTGLCRYVLEQNAGAGVYTGSVNCLVTECNDGRLNDIQGLHVREEHVLQAISAAGETFEEGAVGGGTGMCCLGLKGGIGSASRVVELDGTACTVGALVMANFGRAGDLMIGGRHIDTRSAGDRLAVKDDGSIIMLLATDVPLSERQLGRVARRTAVALGRTGSYCGNGSGDIAIAFTTANRVPHRGGAAVEAYRMVRDDRIDPVFLAAVEAVEEAIISALYHARTLTGFQGRTSVGLRDFLGLA
ncbi:MAG: P1 family peptidase [Oscillospiraceae bacterium]|jgi:D-aminopeptidase|nr:P1 family peptidase [Oscillospiraceae bacterium]MCI8758888.1 P1 family peptidase [Oscillospiraceae bacterium]